MSEWNTESPGGGLRPFIVSALACTSLAAGCASQTRWTQLVERNAVTYYYDASSMRRPANLELLGAAIVLIALVANNRHQGNKVGRIEV